MNKVLTVCISVILALIITSFFTITSYAGWSGFQVVTPDNIHEKNFTLTLSKVGITNKFKFSLNDNTIDTGKQGQFSVTKSAWLVISNNRLTEKEKNLRGYFEGSHNKDNPNIIFLSKIGHTQAKLDNYQLEVIIDKSQLNNAYIYVGYDRPVNDGGLRYTLDLKSFYMNYLRKIPKG